MSIAQTESIESITELIERFNKYDKIFKLVFFRYNGKNEEITLRYRLRTYKSFMNGEEFVKNLLIQYLKNPIQIPSDLFYVEIYDEETTENLGLDPRYFGFIDDFFIINLTNLFNLESEYIDIIITSKFKLDMNSLIAFHISKQPKITNKNLEKYELTAILKSNQLPERFQFINIDLTINLVLNDFLVHYIPKRYMIAANKWYNMEVYKKGTLRKKNNYFKMIRDKYGIKPIQFNNRIHSIFMEISQYIQDNYKNILEIDNIKGKFTIKQRKGGIKFVDDPGMVYTKLKFETNFDNNKFISHAILTLDISWMEKIFRNYF